MKKLKVNENLLALLLLGAFFAGWEFLILVTAFIWVFCEVGKPLKDLTIKVLVVYGACALTLLCWDVVTTGITAILGGLGKFFQMLELWSEDIDILADYNQYFYQPICTVGVSIITGLIGFVVMLVKFKFIYSVVCNKEMTGVLQPVQTFLTKVEEFAENNDFEETKSNGGKGRYCSKCGTKCDEDATFCTSCGNKF